MPADKHSTRKRGVRGSRAKLARALTAAGLKTQAALAERIADLENLDAVPKDVVNRVFRELPVEVTTLERVARALGVEAYTLYKATDEPGDATSATKHPPSSAVSGKWLIVGAACVLFVSLVLYLAVLNRSASDSSAVTSPVSESDPVAFVPLDLGTATLLVMDIKGDEGGAMTAALRASLTTHFSLATTTSAALLHDLDPATAARRLRAEVVIDGEMVVVGRLTAVRVYILARGVRQQVWAESWPSVAMADRRRAIAENVLQAVRQATGLPTPEGSIGHYPLAPVQDDYLEGEMHLYRPSSELNIKRAQSRFEAALRQDSNYARAHAGLCQTLLEEHWMSDEERALKDAARACGQALQLRPDDPVVAAAHAHFLRRTGRVDDAIALYEKTATAHPKDAALLYGYANTLLAKFNQTSDKEALAKAKVQARNAADVDPTVWQPLFALATMEWFDGNLDGAIAASEEALTRDENEKVMGNLGSFYICAGDIEKARDVYVRAQELNPTSYVGDEFLGQAYYFMGDFQQSAKLRQRAIDSIATGAPEIHEMWGNLGDSYRQIGGQRESIAAYTRAAEIAERDHLRGNATVSDRGARAYYYTMLHSLDSATVPEPVMNGIADDLDNIAAALSSASGLRRMAQTYLLRNETNKARAALERAAATCPGYRKMPDLVILSGHQ